MAENKSEIVISRINEELAKIDNKENNVFFFVVDTKGNPSGSLEYIYNLALITKSHGYNVTMLYQEEEFVGVGEWLGEEYANLPHADIAKNDINVAPSDILFIPELFTNIMIQTKKLPCKRIVILQNYDFVLEQSTVGAQWGDYGILDVVTNTDENARLIKSVFPYLKTTTIKPFISDKFYNTIKPKDMVINIVAKNQSDINKIIKPFYWKYPMYKWVSFRDLRGFPKETFADALRNGVITIWVDTETSFGYSAIEAMKSGSIVIAKVPETNLEWADNGEGKLRNCCVWFNSFHDVQQIIASVVRGVVTDKIPEEIASEVQKVSDMYSYEETKELFTTYLDEVNAKRREEIEAVKLQVKNEEE